VEHGEGPFRHEQGGGQRLDRDPLGLHELEVRELGKCLGVMGELL
jgi:hypothetical protein